MGPKSSHIFPNCRLYLLPTKSNDENIKGNEGNKEEEGLGGSGGYRPWRVYTGVPLKRGQPIAPPDIVLQLYDYDTSNYHIDSINSPNNTKNDKKENNDNDPNDDKDKKAPPTTNHNLPIQRM